MRDVIKPVAYLKCRRNILAVVQNGEIIIRSKPKTIVYTRSDATLRRIK